jgi:hypothetical protein
MWVLQVAMMGEKLQFGVFAHSTFAESPHNLFAGIS